MTVLQSETRRIRQFHFRPRWIHRLPVPLLTPAILAVAGPSALASSPVASPLPIPEQPPSPDFGLLLIVVIPAVILALIWLGYSVWERFR